MVLVFFGGGGWVLSFYSGEKRISVLKKLIKERVSFLQGCLLSVAQPQLPNENKRCLTIGYISLKYC